MSMAILRLPAKKALPAASEPPSAPAPTAAVLPERTPEEKAVRARVQADRERREQIEARRRQGRFLREGMAELQRRWPDLFNAPVPLAVGVGAQIRDALPGMPYAQFRMVLRHWTQSTAYLLAVAMGVERRNLDGSPAGVPAEDQQAFAQEALRKRGKWPVEGALRAAEVIAVVGEPPQGDPVEVSCSDETQSLTNRQSAP